MSSRGPCDDATSSTVAIQRLQRALAIGLVVHVSSATMRPDLHRSPPHLLKPGGIEGPSGQVPCLVSHVFKEADICPVIGYVNGPVVWHDVSQLAGYAAHCVVLDCFVAAILVHLHLVGESIPGGVSSLISCPLPLTMS